MSGSVEAFDHLSPTMARELRSVLSGRPDSVHEYDREPEMWTRCTPKRTAQALMRRGLVDAFFYDYPIGNYRCHLTTMGVEVRRSLRAK